MYEFLILNLLASSDGCRISQKEKGSADILSEQKLMWAGG